MGREAMKKRKKHKEELITVLNSLADQVQALKMELYELRIVLIEMRTDRTMTLEEEDALSRENGCIMGTDYDQGR